MLAKRIIPCLDVHGGRVVKGVNFAELMDVGDPAEMAQLYHFLGADELVFLDISATMEARETVCQTVEAVAAQIVIPLTVGGGIRSVDDMKKLLQAGADKISINSQAVRQPELIAEGARMFGSQCIVVAIDAKRRLDETGWNVYTHGGQIDSGIDLLEWAQEVERRGAGEILLTSIDADGTKAGYDLPMIRAVADRVKIPLIASGGAGVIQDFVDVLSEGGADAALAASLFHFNEVKIPALKLALQEAGIPVQPL